MGWLLPVIKSNFGNSPFETTKNEEKTTRRQTLKSMMIALIALSWSKIDLLPPILWNPSNMSLRAYDGTIGHFQLQNLMSRKHTVAFSAVHSTEYKWHISLLLFPPNLLLNLAPRIHPHEWKYLADLYRAVWKPVRTPERAHASLTAAGHTI